MVVRQWCSYDFMAGDTTELLQSTTKKLIWKRGILFIMTSQERHEARYQRRKAKREQKYLSKYESCNNFEEVFTYSNMYHAYKKCILGVGWKSSTQKCKINAVYNVYKGWENVHKDKPKDFHFYDFDVYERGKKRHIRSVHISERIPQRCLCDYSLIPVLSRSFIYDNGASLAGKGIDFAIGRMGCHLDRYYRRHGNDVYILTFDFKSFFDSISHKVAKRMMRENIQDDKIYNYAAHVVDRFKTPKQLAKLKSVGIDEGVGLGLGSQICQILAVAIASPIDHYVKEVLGIKEYGRYMDDGYLIHHDKKYLRKCIKLISIKAKELGLKINPKKTKIQKLCKGFRFLKIRFILTETGKIIRKLARESVTRMRRKLKKFKKLLDEGKMILEDIRTSVQSWISHVNKMNSYGTKCSMLALCDKLFDGRIEVKNGV